MKRPKLNFSTIAFCFLTLFCRAQDCSELFISEYVIGTGNNRALELYNPTPNPIDLSTYSVGRFRDGSGTPMLLSLSGIIEAYSTYVITIDKRDPNGTGFDEPISPVLEALSDTFVNPVYVQANSPFYFNGDDGVPLFNGDPLDPSNLKDLIGRIGEDPGTAWADTNGVWWTRDHTLYRKSDVLSGHQDYLEEFLVQTEWDSLSIDDFSGLGWHNCACPFGASPSFQPETASICDSFQFNSFTSETIDGGAPMGEIDFYYDAFRINGIIGLPAGVAATTNVMASADGNAPYGYWLNNGTPPNQTPTQGTLSMAASQATINGLIGGGPNSDGVYPFQVILESRLGLTNPDLSFVFPNGTWMGNSGLGGLDTLNLFLQIENCGGGGQQPCESAETVLFVGLDANYALTDGPIALVGAPSGGLFIGSGITADSFDPASAGIGTHGITYAIIDGNGCVGAYSICTDVNLTVGGTGSELTVINAEVYPNPSAGLYTLSIPEEYFGSSYSVFASGGHLVDAGIVLSKKTTINLVSYASGSYIFLLQTTEGDYESILIKQ